MSVVNRDLRLRHKVLRKHDKVLIRRFRSDGYEHFHLRLYLEGDLNDVDWVEYHLHETFPDPNRKVTSSKNAFALDIWTWGEFTVFATVGFKDGAIQELTHELEYSSELPAGDSDYLDVSKNPSSKGFASKKGES